jgi:hypothetical protein
MYSNLDDQPLGVETQTGMPESIRARLARFSEEHAANAVIAPVEQQYCTRAEMEALRHEMQMRIEAIKADMPRYRTVDMIDHACRPLRDEIAGLKDDLGNVCRALGRYATSECGEVPESDLLTYLKCQVWHSPWLTKDEQKIKSIWSFRVSVEVRHHRLPEEINVRLFPIRQFYKMAKKPSMRTEPVIEACEYFLDHGGDDAWAGFIQGFTRKKGRPYVKDQVGFIHGHQSDVSPLATQVRVSFLLGGKLHSFSNVRPSNGDAGSSLWWCEWRAGEPSTNEPSA